MSASLAFLPLAAAMAAAPSPKAVRFATADHFTIAALYQPPAKKNGRVALLVHGVGAGKGEWDPLAQRLWELGLGTLAIDLRGHGESSGNYKTFDKKGEWPRTLGDLNAALKFLKRRGVLNKRVGVVGGSIGANLASQLAAENPTLPFVVLLSPGEDYRGVAPGALKNRRAFLAASPGDPYAYQTARELHQRDGGTFVAGKGHGAQLLSDPKFLDALVDWIEKSP